jgi:DHA2 family multidrug resistance protein
MSEVSDPNVVAGPGRRVLILISGVLTVALYFTSILVASTVLPQMQGTFAATPDEISWAITFNILATAIAMPMTGWLVARFGRRQVMIWSTTVFTVSTMLCGTASSLDELILWRIVQGAAGAPSVPLTQTILLDTFPQRQHRAVLGIYGMGVVIGPIAGPSLGGYLAESHNWRWAFFLLVPVGAVAAFGLAASLLRDRGVTNSTRFDWTGFLLLSTAIGALQLMLARGQRLDWFESMEIQVLVLTAAVTFYAFLVHSLTTRNPFLDLQLLRDRNYSLGLALILLFGMLNFTPMVLLPTLMRTHLGYPDVLVGQVVAARGIGGILGFFAVIFISRLDPRVSVAIGFLLQVVSGLWLMRIDLNVTALELELNGIIQGLSAGIVVVALTLTTFAGIDRGKMPEATAVYHLLRNLGATLFISISVAEVVRSTGVNYSRMTEVISLYNKALTMPWVTGLWEIESLAGLERLSREMSRQAALIAYVNAFGLYTAVSAAAIPLVMLLGRAKRAA